MSTSAVPPRGGSEDRLLTVPNVISGIRLACVPVFLWLFLSGREDAGVAVFAAGAGTDFLDGYIARRTGAVSALGKLLDPLADRIFIVALAVALVGRAALPLWLALTVVARDVVLVAAFPLLERRKLERIPVNFVGKSATAALFAGLTFLALAETSWAVGDDLAGAGLALTALGAVLYWVAAGLYAHAALGRLRAGRPQPPP